MLIWVRKISSSKSKVLEAADMWAPEGEDVVLLSSVLHWDCTIPVHSMGYIWTKPTEVELTFKPRIIVNAGKQITKIFFFQTYLRLVSCPIQFIFPHKYFQISKMIL